jgi:cytochrome c-type biogenesis protein CcmE
MEQEFFTTKIPAELVERRRSGFNIKFLVGGVLLLLLVVFLGFQFVSAATTDGAYFLTVSELKSRAPAIYTQRVRVSGDVVAGSEDWNSREVTLKFTVSDENGDQLPIVFYGPRPDNFQRAASAIIEGELNPDGTFHAETLLLKCPSRYEEEPEEIYVESTR